MTEHGTVTVSSLTFPTTLPVWMVESIQAVARSRAEEEHRPLREAKAAGVTAANLDLTTRYLSWGQYELLLMVVLAHFNGGRYQSDWWVGDGGDWGSQALACAKASTLRKRLADCTGPDADRAWRTYTALVDQALAPVEDEWERQWREDLRAARADWAWLRHRLPDETDTEAWDTDAHTATRRPMRRGAGRRTRRPRSRVLAHAA